MPGQVTRTEREPSPQIKASRCQTPSALPPSRAPALPSGASSPKRGSGSGRSRRGPAARAAPEPARSGTGRDGRASPSPLPWEQPPPAGPGPPEEAGREGRTLHPSRNPDPKGKQSWRGTAGTEPAESRAGLTWGAGRQALRMASELVCRCGYLGSCRMGCMLNACLLFMDIMVGAERGRPGQGRALRAPGSGARYCLAPPPGINGIIARPPRPPPTGRGRGGPSQRPPPGTELAPLKAGLSPLRPWYSLPTSGLPRSGCNPPKSRAPHLSLSPPKPRLGPPLSAPPRLCSFRRCAPLPLTPGPVCSGGIASRPALPALPAAPGRFPGGSGEQSSPEPGAEWEPFPFSL